LFVILFKSDLDTFKARRGLNLASVCDFPVLHVEVIVFFCLWLADMKQTDKTEEGGGKNVS
jgi:hypothetical protein